MGGVTLPVPQGISENPYRKSFRPGTSPTGYQMNRDLNTLDSDRRLFGKNKKKARVQRDLCYYSMKEETTFPKTHCKSYYYSVSIVFMLCE